MCVQNASIKNHFFDSYDKTELIDCFANHFEVPNSGTSYTIQLTEEVSGFTTATNYGQEVAGKNFPLVQVSSDPQMTHGPFLLNPWKRIPSYTLTKAHCHGYGQRDFIDIITIDAFESGCQRTQIPRSQNLVEVQTYNMSVPVVKAVHLFRNPVDNLVARWRHGQKTIDNDIPTFKEWCEKWDNLENSKMEEDAESKLPNHWPLLKNLHCRTDWFLYIQWHNLAIEVTKKHNLEVLYMNYEDYETKFSETKRRLLNFLELPSAYPHPPFQSGKSYTEMYSLEQKKLAKEFAQAFASEETWAMIKRYFEGIE